MTVMGASDDKLGRDFWLLSLTIALIGIGFQGMAQLLKVLYVLRLGFGAEFVGVIFATGATCFALASVPAGALGARFGPRRVMIAGALVNVFSMLVLAASDLLPAGARAVGPLLFEVLGPMGWSVLVVNQVAALTAVTTARNRKHAFGLKEGILGIGIFAGSLVAGFLPGLFAGLIGQTTADPAPYRYAMIVAALVSLTGLAPLLLLSPLRASERPRLERATLPPLRPLLVIAVCAFLVSAALASARAFSPAYLDTVFGLPTALIGAIISMGTFAAILAAFGSAGVARQRGSMFAMLVASLVMSAGLVCMAAFPGWGIVAVGLVCTIGFSSMWLPAYQVVQMEMASPEWRAVVAGVGSMAGSVGFGTMSLAGGFIVVNKGYHWLYAIAAAMVLLSAALVLILQARRRTHRSLDTGVQNQDAV